MPVHSAIPPTARASKRARVSPLSAGLPDPRPLTDYTAEYSEADGASRVTVTLEQPCIIRDPKWSFIDCADGGAIAAPEVEILGNDTIVFRFGDIIAGTVILVDVPYQDAQVQNFQGGFVRPGGKWFRAPE